MHGKKVTFSQVVDQMACSLSRSTSSSLSDLATDDVKLAVQPSFHLNHRRRSRRIMRRMGSGGGEGASGKKARPAKTYNSVNSGSEASMESLEMSCSTLHPRTLSVFPQAAGGGAGRDHRHIQRLPSADSLLTALRNLSVPSTSSATAAAVVLSTPVSPQHSESGSPKVLPATPLASPASPQSDQGGGVIGETQVEIHSHPHFDDSDSSYSGSSPTANAGSDGGGGLSLDVPGFHYGNALSPIAELPSPLPTPAPSPLPQQRRTSSASSCDQPTSPVAVKAPSPTISKRLSFRQRFSRKKSCPVMPASAAAHNKSESLALSLDSQPTPIMRRRSITCDGTYFEETSFIVPTSVPGGRPSQAAPTRKDTPPKRSGHIRPPLVPTITLTLHDSDEEKEKSEANGSDGNGAAPTEIVIPQVYITADGDQVNGMNNHSTSQTRTDRAQPCQLNSTQNGRPKAFSKNETKDTLSTPYAKIKLKETTSHNSETGPPPQNSAGRSGRQEAMGKSKSLGSPRRGSLTRQEVVVVEEEHREEDQDEVKHLQHLPKPFDSAPRSRSQSVELPEFRVAQPHPKIVLVQSETPETAEKEKCHVARHPPKSPACSPNNKADGDSWVGIRLGSPPLQKAPVSIPSPPKSGGIFVRGASPLRVMAATVADPDKSSSLDLPCLPPTIMVTPISEVESDSEATTGTPGSSSSAAAAAAAAAIAVQAGPQMHYLSPFTHIVDHRRSSASSTCSAVSTGGGGCGGGGSGGHGSRTTSESNLSSSGYGLFEEFYIVRRVLNQLVPVKVQKSDLDYSTFPDILL